MYQFAELSLEKLLQEIGRSDFPSPAGVSAGAYIAAIAASLLEMSCGCTLDEQDCSAVHAFIAEKMEQCRRIRAELLILAQMDVQVFADFLQAEGERKQQCSWETVDLPLQVAEKSVQLLQLIRELMVPIYQPVAADLTMALTVLNATVKNMILSARGTIMGLSKAERQSLELVILHLVEEKRAINQAIQQDCLVRV